MIGEDDLKIFLTGLQNGLNFTECCNLVLQSPKDVTEYLQKTPVIYAKCLQAIKVHKQFLLQHATKYANDKRVVSWAKTIHDLRKSPDKLYMWESYCKKDELTSEKFLLAKQVINNLEQVATACGYTYEELIQFINKHEELGIYLAINE